MSASFLLPQHAKAFIPSFTTFTPSDSGATSPGKILSFGFFFDTASNVCIDALGFAGDTDWANNKSYKLKLWSFINRGADLTDYTKIAEATFTEVGSYTLHNNYYRQAIAGEGHSPFQIPVTKLIRRTIKVM